MGLLSTQLGPVDQSTVTKLAPEVLRVLRLAAGTIKVGDAAMLTWFGDNGAVWTKSVRTDLNKMASVVNLQSIDIHGSELNRRGAGTFAAAQRPNGGWGKYTGITASQNQKFEIRLDLKWNSAPIYATATSEDSKFQTLIHELTHLILNTDDESYNGADAYGVAQCKGLAASDPATAKTNADNWGYFVESFR